MTDPTPCYEARYEAHMRTFRFYIGLSVYANIAYAPVLGGFIAGAYFAPFALSLILMIVPGMVSTGFAALSGFAVREAISLHRAIQADGAAAGLAHITHSAMLPVQTTMTLIFHALVALLMFSTAFFRVVL
ncbi:MAG: hypothetical protein AAF318_11520 [Pseudomonadota bacterium]